VTCRGGCVAQELLKLAGKQAVLVHDPDRQRPEMLPHELLQAETAARMPRSKALGSLMQSIVATSKVRQAGSTQQQCMIQQRRADIFSTSDCLANALSGSPDVWSIVSQEAAAWLAELGLLRLLGAWLRVLRILPPANTAAEVRIHRHPGLTRMHWHDRLLTS